MHKLLVPVLMAVAVLLSACGLKGPLFLPSHTDGQPQGSETQASESGATDQAHVPGADDAASPATAMDD